MKYLVLYLFGSILLSLSLSISSFGQISTTESISTADSSSFFNPDSLPEIRHKLGRYFIEKRLLSTREVFDRLSCVDSTAYNLFQKGKQGQKIGGIVALIGAGIFVVGEVIYVTSAINDFLDIGPEKSGYPGTEMMIIGGGLEVSGFAVAILSKIKKNHAVKLYNQTVHSRRHNFSWYAKPSINKISIGLRF